MDHTHFTHTLLFFYFDNGDYLCNVVFLFLSDVSCLSPGPALEDGVLFPSLFTFLLLVALIF